MTDPTICDLNADQKAYVVETNAAQVQGVVGAAKRGTVSQKALVFLAAFDGTNNDLTNLESDQPTNVAQLYKQCSTDARVKARYYSGPGTAGTRPGSSWAPARVTTQVIAQAEEACRDFAKLAKAWLAANPRGAVTTVVTGFSRGCASAAIYSQMLADRGLVDPATGSVLVAKGRVIVSAGVLFDPVTTGVLVDLAFAPDARNVVTLYAVNEYRQAFKAADYRGQPGIETFRLFGAHSDIGGQYDNGIGSQTLEAAVQFLRKAGLPLKDIPKARRFDAAAVNIHDASRDRKGKRIWSVDGAIGDDDGQLASLDLDDARRLMDTVVRPDRPRYDNPTAAREGGWQPSAPSD